MKNKLILGLFIGLFVGILAGVGIMKITTGGVCPEEICLSDSAIPISDRDYFIHVHNSIKNAKKSVLVVIFSMKHYTSPEYRYGHEETLLSDLIEASKRGVEVKVLLDDYPEGNNKTYSYLKENGVEVKFDQENTTTHAKLIIIDGKVVIIGSSNWSYHALDLNHETNILIKSSELGAHFEEYFNKLWDE